MTLKNSLRKKLTALVLVAIIPLLALSIFLLAFMNRFQNSYDEIVSNMTIASSYDMNFKEEMDECIYKLVFNGQAFAKPLQAAEREEDANVNPYTLIYELHSAFEGLAGITTDEASASWLGSLLRNIDTLEDRVDDIRANLIEGGHYNENIEMLDNNIYILTDLINEDIQYYIYFQTRSIEKVRDELRGRMQSFLAATVMLLAVLLGVEAVTMAIILRNITGSLSELTRVTERIAQGDFGARTSIRTSDEIGQVAASVNDMAEHLEVMVGQIKEDERKMRNSELRLLQEQINPHFLYNTLDAIVWLIEGGKDEQAEDMVMSLSDFFKLALSHGREFITIREEELHIRSYLQIQQVRYAQILSYEIRIDPEIYQYQILKLTLQPLVENALYHGIKPKRSGGRVIISGWMQEDHTICLTVEDDGVGMAPEELEEMRRQITLPCSDETSRGFGMANVSERIRLNFGKEYGMQIDSVQGEGTKVTIVIPAQWMKEKEE